MWRNFGKLWGISGAIGEILEKFEEMIEKKFMKSFKIGIS